MTAASTVELSLRRSSRRETLTLWWARWWPWVPLAVVALFAIIGPLLVPFDPEKVVARPSIPPGSNHLMGTDSVGLDVFSRTVSATRLNLTIGLAVALLSSIAGAVTGVLVGMGEERRGLIGRGARTMARTIELSSALPPMLVALAVVAITGPSVTTLTVVIAASLTPNLTRLTRTEVLKVRHDAYLDAARQAGLSEFRMMVRHVFPNSVWPVAETFSITFGSAIMMTAGLGFLGVGVPAPTPEWGAMISRSIADLTFGRWWASGFPALAMAFTVLLVALPTTRRNSVPR
nr:ABC transporter permease [Micromonospora sp. DSM 115978]